VDTPPAPGAFNMALDQALMASVGAGGDPVLRFYRWSPACVSLGRNQPAAGRYDEGLLRARGIDVVRRLTGGRAVLHARELTYSAVMPDRALGSARAAYASINRALVAGLRRLGVPAALQPPSALREPVPSLAPCFQHPAEGEVVSAGRKLVGSAQVRQAGVILQHGSLLFHDDQGAVAELIAGNEAPAPLPAASLADFVDPLPAWEEIVDALLAGWASEIGPVRADGPSPPPERDLALGLAGRYRSPEWTWRR
jgi:lipoate-protein ligase A